jgi:probable F420-dependent oxidoreductase
VVKRSELPLRASGLEEGEMKIGVSRPPTPRHPVPDVDGAVVAELAEDIGFESIFYGEHPIHPVDQPGSGVHAHGVPFFQDTLVMLARASAMTSRIKLGSGVFLIPEHNPVLFAKQLASLDHYSRGRLVVGAGVGWSRIECELLGGNFDRRWAQTCEAIQLMKRLWTEDTVQFRGEFFDVPPVRLFPQPASKPWPPVLLGAAPSERTFRRIVAVADGWIPAFVEPAAVEGAPSLLEKSRARLDTLAVEAGREPTTIQITAILRGPQVDGDLGPGQRVDRALVARLADAGVDRVAVSLRTIHGERDAREALAHIADDVL